MLSFKEAQEKFKERINKNVNMSKLSSMCISIAPIKFEIIDDEIHIFLMMCKVPFYLTITSDNRYSPSSNNIKQYIMDKLKIVLPIIESNKVYINPLCIYVFDGSKLDTNMINYLNKCNGDNIEYEWMNITDSNHGSSIAQDIKGAIMREISSGKIFQ